MKRLFPAAIAAALALIYVFYVGCSSSDDPVEPSPAPVPTSVSGAIGPGGGTLTSDDGLLSITFPQGALAADTQVRITATDAADANPVFSGFDGRAALAFEPRGVALAKVAELSYTFPLRTTSTTPLIGPLPSPPPEDPEDFIDVLVALLEEEGDQVFIPNQEVDYDNDGGNVRFKLQISYTGDIMMGKPVQKDKPQEGDNFGVYGMHTEIDGPAVKDESFTAHNYLWVGDLRGLNVEGGGMTMVDPPTTDLEAGLDDGDPIPSILDELSNGFDRYQLETHYTPKLSGSLGLKFNMGFELAYDVDKLDLPPNTDKGKSGDIRVTLRYKTFEFGVLECSDPPCEPPPPTGQIDIVTGLEGQKDLSVAFWDATVDPPPMGQGPWLFVTGDSAVYWYRLSEDQQGKITSTERVGELPWIGSTGTIPAAQGIGDRTRCLFLFGGSAGGWRTCWNDAANDWGAIVLASATVTDASSYMNTSDSRGWVWANGSSVQFIEYDSSSQLYFQRSGTTLYGFNFPEANGGPTSAAVGDNIETVMVVMDGNPAEIWWHDRADVSLEAIQLGVAGNGAKQIRAQGGIFAITNNGSNSITLGTWNGPPSVKGTETVGNGPWGVDVMALSGGGAAVLCTSSSDNTYTLLTVDANGSVTLKATKDLPGSCFAQYAIFVPGPTTYIAFSCQGTKSVSLIETDLQAALR